MSLIRTPSTPAVREEVFRILLRAGDPHAEKVFSVFEPHTERISKGKAGVPVELGLRVCVLEDQFGFILHHRVMCRETDDQVAMPMVAGGTGGQTADPQAYPQKRVPRKSRRLLRRVTVPVKTSLANPQNSGK